MHTADNLITYLRIQAKCIILEWPTFLAYFISFLFEFTKYYTVPMCKVFAINSFELCYIAFDI